MTKAQVKRMEGITRLSFRESSMDGVWGTVTSRIQLV